jgi:hypothetical protein
MYWTPSSFIGTLAALPLPACGERVGVRGRFHESEPSSIAADAQTRGEAPSPGSLPRSDLSPHAGRGSSARSWPRKSREIKPGYDHFVRAQGQAGDV